MTLYIEKGVGAYSTAPTLSPPASWTCMAQRCLWLSYQALNFTSEPVGVGDAGYLSLATRFAAYVELLDQVGRDRTGLAYWGCVA